MTKTGGHAKFEDTIAYSWFGYSIRVGAALPKGTIARLALPTFAVLFVLIMFFIDPSPGRSAPIPPKVTAMFWAGVVLFYFAIYFRVLRLWNILRRYLNVPRLYLQPPSAAVVAILMVFGEVWLALLMEGVLALRHPVWILYPFYYLAEQAFQLMFISAVALLSSYADRDKVLVSTEQSTQDVRPSPSPEPALPPAYITLGNQTVLVAHLLSATSTDHHLTLACVNGDKIVRETMARFLEQIPPDVGFQVHRSHWVARSAIAEFSLGGSVSSVTVKNGQTLPIARGRKTDFQKWVNTPTR